MENIMLIVDDVEMNRDILKVLFHTSYEILEAEDGTEALEILERCQGSIDIVLLDLMMPGISGFDMLEKRKQLDYFREVPVVVITSSGQMEDQIRAFEMGANDYIAKPFIPEIVVTRVNNVMTSNKRMVSIEMEAQKLKIKSELDEMTGIYNKSTTEIAMNEVLKHGNKQQNVMLVIDIDNFKTVNDTSGHQSGDHVIRIIADLISSLFRKTDIVGRIGGDEFCVLMVDVPDMSVVLDKTNELIQIMRYKPNLTIPEYVTLSIGVASNKHQKMTYADLFTKADEALYQAKENGKAQYYVYGTENTVGQTDERPALLLIGNNRNICSMIHAMTPAEIRIVEALRLEDIDRISKEDQQRMTMIYVDVSDYKQGLEEYLQKIISTEWIKKENMIAICEEGNVKQYMAALQCGAADIITEPIDGAAYKRRLLKQLEQFKIIL